MGDKEGPDELTGRSGGRRAGNEVKEAVQSKDKKDDTKKKTSYKSSDFHVSFLFYVQYIDINTVCIKIKSK